MEETQEPTFHGFKKSDFGYDPTFDLPETKDLDVFNLAPEEGILTEYQELFGDDGYLERSMYVDHLGGNVLGWPTTELTLRLAARRNLLGVKLPPKADTFALIQASR